MTGVTLPASIMSARAARSSLSGFARNSATFWLVRREATRSATLRPSDPTKRLSFGPPTQTSFAPGFNIRRHSRQLRFPAMSNSAS